MSCRNDPTIGGVVVGRVTKRTAGVPRTSTPSIQMLSSYSLPGLNESGSEISVAVVFLNRCDQYVFTKHVQ